MKRILSCLFEAAIVLLAMSCRVDGTSFVYFTDTHFPESECNQAVVLEPVCKQMGVSRVFWGGDAIQKFADIDDAWDIQMKMQHEIESFATFYPIRGNHDFSTRDQSGEGFTLPQSETAARMRAARPEGVVINDADPDECYYYVDDERSRIRFVVMDTHDKVGDTDKPMSAAFSIGEKQLRWLCDEAVGNAPDGYSLILFGHTPIWWTAYKAPYVDQFAAIKAAASSNDVKIIAWIAGHIHRDTQFCQNGQWEITTACDIPQPRLQMFEEEMTDRSGDNVHCMDVFSIDKGHHVLKADRIGGGSSRIFHLDALSLKVGESITVKPSLTGTISWVAVNAYGDFFVDGGWHYANDFVSVSDCVITGEAPGEAMVVSVDSDGDKEFFVVDVRY